MENRNQTINHDNQLIIESSLQNGFYVYNQLEPTVYFWREMIQHYPNTPTCLVPDTLIINGKENETVWVYTDKNGHITSDSNATFKDFVFKLVNYSSPNELVGIFKRPIYHEKLAYINEIKLLNSRYLMNCSQQQLGQKDHVVYLQRFIKSNGKKAFLCRTIYKQESSHTCYLITNKKTFWDCDEPEQKRMIVHADDKSNIVKSKHGQILKHTIKCLEDIVKYFRFQRGFKITELVGDFIKDEVGNWWLVNIKAFKVEEKLSTKSSTKINNFVEASEEVQKQRYQKTKICRYCEKNYLESELTHKMTMKMIMEVDKYLLHMGKDYKWLRRSDVSNVQTHCLYQQHKVCLRCYRMYSEIQQILEIEKKYLKVIGCQLEQPPKQLIISQTNEKQLKQQAKAKQIKNLVDGIPEIIELGPNSNITTKNDIPLKNDEIINQMMRFRMIFFLNEIDQIPSIQLNNHYFLQYAIFGVKVRHKLDLSMAHIGVIPLRKLKVIYFFAHSEDNLENYANSGVELKLNLITENKMSQERKNVGHLILSLKDYMDFSSRKKDFYKFFHLEGVPYGWGLEGSIGFLPNQTYVNTSRIVFSSSDKQIYLPNQNYYFCEHLPQQWIDQIKLKYTQSRKNEQKLKTLRNESDAFEKDKCESLVNNFSKMVVDKSYVSTGFCWKDQFAREIENYCGVSKKKRKSNFRHRM